MHVGETRSWMLREVVQWMTDDLRKRGIEGARLDAELIVGQAMGLDRVAILVHGERVLEADELERIRELFRRRRTFEPVAYLRGQREFYGRVFQVDRRVLVPRPDTEILVEVALSLLKGRELHARVLDLCTGSGCVGVSIKCEVPTIYLDGADLSDDALAVAKRNARRLGAVMHVRWLHGDLFAALPPQQAKKRYDLIVANPPYIERGDIATLQPDIREHEPHLALDGGDDGLAIVRRIVEQAPQWLTEGGALAMELGAGQAATVLGYLQQAGFEELKATRDYGGHERVVSGRLPHAR